MEGNFRAKKKSSFVKIILRDGKAFPTLQTPMN